MACRADRVYFVHTKQVQPLSSGLMSFAMLPCFNFNNPASTSWCDEGSGRVPKKPTTLCVRVTRHYLLAPWLFQSAPFWSGTRSHTCPLQAQSTQQGPADNQHP